MYKTKTTKNRLHLLVFFTIYFFLFTSPTETYAQSLLQNFKKIKIEIEGMKISEITSIVEDKEGYIWMGTSLGLLKYNGYEFIRYKNNSLDSTSLHNNNVKALHLDSEGDLWVGTKAGLSRYNPACDCFIRYPSTPNNDKNTPPTGFIADITEDSNKNVWFASKKGKLFSYNRKNDQFTRFLQPSNDSTSLSSDIFHVLLADQEKNIWIGTGFGNEGTGLIRFNPTSGEVKRFIHDSSDENSLLDNRISALYEDQKGQLFIGTYKCGLHIYNKEKETFQRLEFDAQNPNKLHAPYSEEQIPGLGLNRVDPSVDWIHQD